ncbi:MAG: DUF1328 domain-containing protein [Acidobacteriota bacterium]|nr:DUF1328 domain-containing protein [Acidobacteriota bacterium]
MLRWTVILPVVVLTAALLGLGGIAAGAGIAKLLFTLFLIVFVASMLMGLVRRV